MSVIDLGSGSDFDLVESPDATRHGEPWVGWVFAVLFALSTLVSAAPARERIPQLFELAVPPESRITMAGSVALISGESTIVTAFDMARGRPAWRTDTGVRALFIATADDRLLVEGVTERDLNAGLSNAAVASLDRADGKVLWRKAGRLEYLGSSPGGLTIVSQESAFPDTDSKFIAVNPDGSDAWTLTYRGLAPMIDPRRRVIATIDPVTGLFVERDLGTLKEVRRATVPAFRGVSTASYAGNTIEVMVSTPTELLHPEVYDVATLRRSPAPSEADTGRRDCGVVWCDFEQHALVDKATGKEVYRFGLWASAMYTDAGVVGLTRVGPDVDVAAIWDSRTRRALPLGAWTLLNRDVWLVEPKAKESLLLAQSGPKTTRLAMFDDSGLFIAGLVPVGDVRSCARWDRVIACVVGEDRVRVWRVR